MRNTSSIPSLQHLSNTSTSTHLVALPIIPHRREHQPRMRHRERNTRQRNHAPIQHQKRILIPHPRVSPPARHLRQPINTAYQNRHEREPNTPRKHPKPYWTPRHHIIRQCRCIHANILLLILLGIGFSLGERAGFPAAQEEIEHDAAADEHGDGLQGDAGYDEGVAGVEEGFVRAVFGGGGDAAADGLHDYAA